MRRFLAMAAAALLGTTILLGTTTGAATAAPCTGTGPVEIISMSFNPARVVAGQSSAVTAVVQNCTNQTVNLNSDWYGLFSSPPAPGIAPGCMAIDPLPESFSLPALGQVTRTKTYPVRSGCTATDLALTFRINLSTGIIQQVAHLAIGPGASTGPCAGTAAVEISSMAFSPTTVTAGQSSTVTAVVRNCTNQAQSISSYWYGRYTSPPATDIAPGCPAIDPLVTPLNLPAGGQVTVTKVWSTFASCTATKLTITYHVSSPDGVDAQRSADLTIGHATTPPPATCAVSYVRQSEWAGGFVASVTVKNTGASPVNGWTLVFTFPGDQKITNAWNATVSQTGAVVTAKGPTYATTIAPAASVNFGFQGTWHTSDASPTSFTLNGSPCTTA